MSPVDRARHFLDNWKVWMLVAYLALAACVVSLFVLFSKQAGDEASRVAQRKADAVSQVSVCYQSVDTAPRVIRILALLDILASNSIMANRQAIADSPPDDRLRATREASLERLLPARADLRRFIAATAANARTVDDCRKLAVSLGVNPERPKGATP